MSEYDRALYLMKRGTAQQHKDKPFPIRAGNFTLVTDKPQLRFHDGETPGGIVIQLAEETWNTIKAKNVIIYPTEAPKKGFWRTLLEYIRN